MKRVVPSAAATGTTRTRLQLPGVRVIAVLIFFFIDSLLPTDRPDENGFLPDDVRKCRPQPDRRTINGAGGVEIDDWTASTSAIGMQPRRDGHCSMEKKKKENSI